MKKYKNKKILKIIFILILIIIFIKILYLKELSKIQNIDDFLFLKLLSNGDSSKINNKENNSQIQSDKIYKFKVSYKNLDFKTINLSKTVNQETLLYEKIAPGTSGSFNILLYSDMALRYKIKFDSINRKPQNLRFKALKDNNVLCEANTLEELEKDLNGNIDKNQIIDITINWYWDFENLDNKQATDMQDTKDSENIKKYEFSIYTFGE